jgi:tetratricopeptide (TPR) repeat protein
MMFHSVHRVSLALLSKPLYQYLAILALVLFFYQGIFWAGFIWDDDSYVINQMTLRTFDGLRRIWIPGNTPQYYPLVFTTFWLEYQFFELAPLPYHLTNLILHCSSAFLLARLLRRLDVPGAWLVALVFALHPVHVESVTWVTERKNVLSGVCYLLSLAVFLDYSDRGRPRDYVLSLALFVAALLSKTVTCTLPVVMGMVIIYRNGRVGVRDVAALLPFFVIGAGMGLFTAHLEVTHVGASGPHYDLTLVQRFLIASKAILFYAGKLVWPSNLAFSYPKWSLVTMPWYNLWPLFAVGSLLALATTLYFKNRYRGIVSCFAFFVVTLLPALGFFDVFPFRYSYVADHFQYLASIGVIIVMVQVGFLLWERRPAFGRHWDDPPWPRYAAVATILIALGTASYFQVWIYRDSFTLWRDTLEKNPRSWLANNNMALIYMRVANYDAALEHLRVARDVDPNFAQTHVNFGLIAAVHQRHDEAIGHYSRAIALQNRSRRALKERGKSYAALGLYKEALADYGRLIKIGQSASAYRLRGDVYTELGRKNLAKRDYAEAKRRESRFAPVR